MIGVLLYKWAQNILFLWCWCYYVTLFKWKFPCGNHSNLQTALTSRYLTQVFQRPWTQPIVLDLSGKQTFQQYNSHDSFCTTRPTSHSYHTTTVGNALYFQWRSCVMSSIVIITSSKSKTWHSWGCKKSFTAHWTCRSDSNRDMQWIDRIWGTCLTYGRWTLFTR